MKRLLAITAALSAAPALAANPKLETAVLAGGCFWGVEAVFERVKGVASAVAGYSGGSKTTANYSAVSSNGTGHAEAVRISYDPRLVSYSDLLRIFFTVAHDPTQLNRQGPDIGPSYRSAIFPQSPAQKLAAERFIAALDASRTYPRPIVTRIESGPFFPAEAYHQDFLRKNPRHPYVLAHDMPKLAALKRKFPAVYRD